MDAGVSVQASRIGVLEQGRVVSTSMGELPSDAAQSEALT